jgi:flavin-binding protein dodecin/transposase-like protein
VSDTELLPKSKLEPVRRLEVFTGAGRRRTWTAEQKAQILAESYESGEKVSAVARRHGLTPQQLFGWRRDARRAVTRRPQARERLSLVRHRARAAMSSTIRPAPVVDAARWVRAADDVNIAARPSSGARRTPSEDAMAKKQADAVYRIVDVVGVSETSWEDAGRNAVKTAAGSLRDLRVAEVTKMDMKVENGKVAAFRTRVALSFKYEA